MSKRRTDPPEDSDEDVKPAPAVGISANDFMTTKELMDYLQISRTKVWDLVNNQGLPAFKLGGDYRYRRAEIDAWMEGFRVNPGERPV